MHGDLSRLSVVLFLMKYNESDALQGNGAIVFQLRYSIVSVLASGQAVNTNGEEFRRHSQSTERVGQSGP